MNAVKEIRENAFDIKATSRLNRLYVELLKDNPDWATDARRTDLNHFMARLIFCFFAEDTDIFRGRGLFTDTVEQKSECDSSNTHEIISELFQTMNTRPEDRERRSWADAFPYVNGSLFSGNIDVPRFSRLARSYLLDVGRLDWTRINPDIFGSMIQAIAHDEERDALGMHYTSLPNILKVLNPLFLDELREKLAAAGDDSRKLLNLRDRLARIRVFDPACGSGNFLVIAYKQLRAIEAEINARRGDHHLRSQIPLPNFRGIELRNFSAEIARLALIIAKFQCDVLDLGPQQTGTEFLPCDEENWITCGNALRLDWLSVCPPTADETYICGNPPYKGTKNQTPEQKRDLEAVFKTYDGTFKVLDYVSAWFIKGAEYLTTQNGALALVSTNSICQGNQVPILWPLIRTLGLEIHFAHTSFKWANLAAQNAGVTVVVIGLKKNPGTRRRLFTKHGDEVIEKRVPNINAYLVPAGDVIVTKKSRPPEGCDPMVLGNQPYEGGHLIFTRAGLDELSLESSTQAALTRKILGSTEVIKGRERFCLWIEDHNLALAESIPSVKKQIDKVRSWRLKSRRPGTKAMAARAHQFCEMKSGMNSVMIIPIRSSESREYLPIAIYDQRTTANNLAYAIYDGALFNFSLIASRMHLIWVSTVCGKLETRFSYSNKMGWNTFPIPTLTEANKADLTRCAEDILQAREAHSPATIADLYDPKAMPDDLRAAHDRNDEVLEHIYIGRRFKNDTERLECLFELYTEMADANSVEPAPPV